MLTGVRRRLPVRQERNPARQIRILQRHNRGVAVVHRLDRTCRDRIDPAGARGRHDHQQLAVERGGALQFGQDHVHPRVFGVGRRQPGVDPDRFLGGASVEFGQLVGVRSGGHEVAALIAEGVPRRERAWAAGSFGLCRLLDPRPDAGILRSEHRARAADEAADQHAVDERDDQHDDDRSADEQRDLVVHPPSSDQVASQRLDHVEQHPRHADQRTADDHRDQQCAQVTESRRAFDAHHVRHLPLPGRGGDDHQHAGRRGYHDSDRLHAVEHPRAGRPPAAAPRLDRLAEHARRCRSRWRR